MTQRDLLNAEHWVKVCSRQQQVRDEQGNLLGITYEAFALRTAREERYLSGAWFECIGGSTLSRLKHLRELWKNINITVRPEAAFAVCNAGKIRGIGEGRGKTLRVRYEPSRKNPAYSAVRGLPYDNSDIDLLELLATDSVVHACCSKEVPD